MLAIPEKYWKKCKVAHDEVADGYDENGSFKYCKVWNAHFCMNHMHLTAQHDSCNQRHKHCPGWFYNEILAGGNLIRQLLCMCKCAELEGNPCKYICQGVIRATDNAKVVATEDWIPSSCIAIDSKPHAKED